MSLPSSEPLPDDINELPPARQRHLRRLPRTATPAERQILLDSLLQLTAPSLDFFLFALLGSLAAGMAFFFDEPILLILALVTLPFNSPIFDLALLPPTQRLGHGLKSLVSLLISAGLAFSAGALSGWLRASPSLSRLSIIHFSAPYWLNLVIVAGSVVLCCLVLLRQNQLPRLAGAFLSYEIMIPLVVAGFGLTTTHAQLWPGALLISLLHLGLALVLAILTFILLGFMPKLRMGWVLALVPLALTLAVLTATMFFLSQKNAGLPPPTSSPTPGPSQTASPKAVEATSTPTEQPYTATMTRTDTGTPTIAPTPTQTPTPEPTTYWGVVEADEGAIIRESPDFGSQVVTYVNDGDLIEILGEITNENNTRWYQVHTATGESGWLLGSLVNTPTPTPSPTSE